MKIEFPQRNKNKSFLSETWEATWSQLCYGKNPHSSDARLTVLVFWPFFLLAFLLIAVYIAILRLLKK